MGCILGALLVGLPLLLSGCWGDDDAKIVSKNVSKAADNFEVFRRIFFLNGVTDGVPLEVIGYCSISHIPQDEQLEVTCKDDNGQYKKHFLGLSDNMSYVVQQLTPVDASAYHYRFTIKPQQILPDIDIRGSFSKQNLPSNQQ